MKYDLKKRSDAAKLHFVDSDGKPLAPLLVKQAFKDECDVNAILKRYRKTGVIEHVSKVAARYGDFSEFKEYREMLDTVRSADEMFFGLPAELRKRFENNPANFVEFMGNPANLNEAVELGLAIHGMEKRKPDVGVEVKTEEVKP